MKQTIITRVIFTLLLLCSHLYADDQPNNPLSNDFQTEMQSGQNSMENQLFENALTHFSNAATLSPSQIEVYENAGICAVYLEKNNEAISWFQRGIEASIPKQNYDKIKFFNDQITTLLEKWPLWVDEAIEDISVLPDTPDILDYQTYWNDLLEKAQTLSIENISLSIELTQKALAYAKKHFGDNHMSVLTTMSFLSELYEASDMTDQFESLMKMIIQQASQSIGDNHPFTIDAIIQLAVYYEARGLFEQADNLYQDAYQKAMHRLGPDHPFTMNTMFIFALFQINQKQIESGKKLLENALSQFSQVMGIHHPETHSCIDKLAFLYFNQGDYQKAKSMLEQLLTHKKQIRGDDAPETIQTLVDLSRVHILLSHLDQAETDLNYALKTYKALLGEDAQEVYLVIGYLGSVYMEKGLFEKAEQQFQAAYSFFLNTLGENDPETLTQKSNIGTIYRRLGRLHDAEIIFKQLYDSYLSLWGPTHEGTINTMNNLALIYEEQGLYEDAEPLYIQALKQAESLLGEHHPTTLSLYNNLGLLYESQGTFNKAKPYYLKAIHCQTIQYGEFHPKTLVVTNNLGYLYMLDRQYTQAEPLFQKVYDQWKKIYGDTHQYTLKALNNLARVYHYSGNHKKADLLLRQALLFRQTHLGDSHLDTIRSMIDLAILLIDTNQFKESDTLLNTALQKSELNLGSTHPYTFDCLNALGKLAIHQNKLNQAYLIYKTIFQRRNEFFNRVLWSTGENAREGYIRLHKPERDAYLSLLVKLQTPESAMDILDVSIQRKGLLLKIASEIQQISLLSKDPSIKATTDRLITIKKDLAALTLSGPVGMTPTLFIVQTQAMQNEINQIQGQLARQSSKFKKTSESVTPKQVFENLSPEDCLIDYMIYKDTQSGKNNLIGVIGSKTPDGKIDSHVIQYGLLAPIRKQIFLLRDMIQDEDIEEEEMRESSHQMYKLLIAPLEKFIQDKQILYIVPDGSLNILPFDALIDHQDQYLIESYDIRMITTCRELVTPELTLATGGYLVIAGPDYNADYIANTTDFQTIQSRGTAQLTEGLRMAAIGMRGLSFDPLPGAEEEGKEIEAICKQTKSTQLFLKNQARELLLREIKTPPEVLHIATHGFFLKSQENLVKRLLKLQRSTDRLNYTPPPGDNPLLRAGLAFAGINKNAPYLGEIDPDNDGVLTALEVLALNLSGTQLVVLSACETGLGEIFVGEGIYGLRRAFQEAGAKMVINSLWEVSDKGTQALMTNLYQRLHKGVSIRKAFREAQLDLIGSYRWSHPYIWSAFIIVGL